MNTMNTPSSSDELLNLSYDSDIHIQLVKQTVTTWTQMEPDLVLLTMEGEKVFTNRIFLSFFSKMIRQICSDISSPELLTISVPASKSSLECLLPVLLTGTVLTSSRENLVMVAETADCLGIDLTDIQIGVKNEEKKNVTKKVSKKGSKKKIENENKVIKKENFDSPELGDVGEENEDTWKVQENSFGKKSYDCTLCDKSFSNKTGVKQHQVVHTGIKPFACDDCEKSFGQKGALLNHKVLHADEKPFKCSFCDKDFTQKGNMKTHMMKVHNEA